MHTFRDRLLRLMRTSDLWPYKTLEYRDKQVTLGVACRDPNLYSFCYRAHAKCESPRAFDLHRLDTSGWKAILVDCAQCLWLVAAHPEVHMWLVAGRLHPGVFCRGAERRSGLTAGWCFVCGRQTESGAVCCAAVACHDVACLFAHYAYCWWVIRLRCDRGDLPVELGALIGRQLTARMLQVARRDGLIGNQPSAPLGVAC